MNATRRRCGVFLRVWRGIKWHDLLTYLLAYGGPTCTSDETTKVSKIEQSAVELRFDKFSRPVFQGPLAVGVDYTEPRGPGYQCFQSFFTFQTICFVLKSTPAWGRESMPNVVFFPYSVKF